MPALYQRLVSIHREGADGVTRPFVAGAAGYTGTTLADETVIATSVPASIQAKGLRRSQGMGITAADAPGPSTWSILIPLLSLAKGSVQDRDIVIDDEGVRYHVASAYWNLLGYQLICTRLEA